MIVSEAIYDVRESYIFPRTFETHFTFGISECVRDVDWVVDAESDDDHDAHADDGVDGEAPEVGDALQSQSNSIDGSRRRQNILKSAHWSVWECTLGQNQRHFWDESWIRAGEDHQKIDLDQRSRSNIWSRSKIKKPLDHLQWSRSIPRSKIKITYYYNALVIYEQSPSKRFILGYMIPHLVCFWPGDKFMQPRISIFERLCRREFLKPWKKVDLYALWYSQLIFT